MSDYSSHAALDVASRVRKASKIEHVLTQCAGIPIRGRMLEVGAGSGLISAYFASRYKDSLCVSALDVTDQRVVAEGFEFLTYDGRKLPFNDGEFQLIVSNHVIEHVGSREIQQAHLGELTRVLAPSGAIYLAAPSKWQPIEPHFGLPLLSWIPRAMRDAYVHLAGKGTRYDCNPMGHADLERMAMSIGLTACNFNAAAFRFLCDEGGGRVARYFRRMPLAWLAAMYRLSPTMVYVLTHRKDARK